MKNIILSGKELSKTYVQSGKESKILTNIDVEFYEGDFTVIMGSSGAGKSTLLYALSGMDTITAGSVIFKGQEISSFSEKKIPVNTKMKARIDMVYIVVEKDLSAFL